ncbi:TIGR00153 family protein [Methanobacterium aggregans]|uniref:TIGR00153 family protein n=1 Tax=Methanobacterium aggregans TaxID=1615586 RepID=UPI001AE83544|nr:TIGR00153 family protein [Methanobacterium aggregans]MBP2046558.1 putative phosphate transport protein (TIGR00153 family) [Methanobacterium aggregans]
MKKLFKKESEVEKHSKEHVELVYECVQGLKKLMEFFYSNDFDSLDGEVEKISQLEHSADIIRRNMEIEFYDGAFLPFDREDRIILAELVDGVADITQEAAYGIGLSRIQFPEKFQEDFMEITQGVLNSVAILKDCIELLDVDLRATILKAHELEEMEDAVDRIERRILRKLYDSYRNKEFGILTLLELKSAVLRLGNVVDRAEDASDRVLIIVAKRKG